MNYTYEALDRQGNKVNGVQDADSDKQARSTLREKGLTPVSVTTEQPMVINTVRLPVYRWVDLTRQLADLTDAGLTLEETLNTIIEQTKHAKTHKTLVHVRSMILSGQSLSSALRDCGAKTPDVALPLISAGENSGQLQQVLHKLADFMEARQALAQKILLAMIYPMMISAVAIIVVFAMMVWVVPQVVSVFISTHQELPFLTKALMWSSSSLKSYGIYLVALLCSFGYGFHHWLKNDGNRKKWHSRLLSAPVIGNLLMEAQVGRLSETLAILINSGVPLLKSLHYGQDVLTLLPLRDAMTGVTQKIQEGASFSKSLTSSGKFPSALANMVASGESSGRLGDMLEQYAKQSRRSLQQHVSIMTSVLEPALILCMGGVVLTIVLAIMMPIFNMNTMIK